MTASLSEIDTLRLFHQFYETLKTQSDLSPNNQTINSVLTRLVGAIMQKNAAADTPFCEKVLKMSQFADALRDICQAAEVEMEKYWAQKLADTGTAGFDALKQFIYFDNYNHITRGENDLIEKNGLPVKKVSFIGSGPLPMTAFILKNIRPNMRIKAIDQDPEAIRLSKNINDTLDLGVDFIQASALDINYGAEDIVFVASMTTDKIPLVKKLYDQGVAYIIMRDAEKFTRLLYEELNPEIFKFYSKKDFVFASQLTVNSSYLLKRK
ncbi:MAG: hypothetical protein LBU87_00390 [Lactobacillales bacterium]|jgi:nicotianamine synthase|nr:hypothetical protein [Lactobacillales bacterium]